MTAMVVAKDFGRYLQTCRRSKGISLEVVSHQTKIGIEILRHIETENQAHLPAQVYVKGFLKAFADAVGADPSEAVQRFENNRVCRAQLSPSQCPFVAPSVRRHSLVLALALFMAQIGATLYLAQWMQNPLTASVPPSVVATQTAPALPLVAKEDEKSALAMVPVVQAKTPPLSPALLSSLELRVTAVEATWLQVVSDDQAPREFLLQEDQDVTLVAKSQFDLVIGNAGGTRLVLNDHPVPVAGKNGQRVTLHLP
jgi:cytoskeleton protein RodZ